MKVYIHRNGQNYGPYTEKKIREYLLSGKVSENDWMWGTGQKEWVPLSDFLERKLEEKKSQNPVSTEVSDAEVSEYFEKILKLVASENWHSALDIVRSLNNPKLYEKLLIHCKLEDGKFLFHDIIYKICSDEHYFLVDELEIFFLELISNCPKAAKIHSSLKIEEIKILNLNYCRDLTETNVLTNFINLTSLNLEFCHSLTSLDSLSQLTNLRSLYLSDFRSPDIDGLSNLTGLVNLHLESGISLTNLDGLSDLTNLENLTITNCNLTNLDSLSQLTNIRSLYLSNFCSPDINGLSNLTSLVNLHLESGESLTDVDRLNDLTNLKNLTITNCNDLECIKVLSTLPKLNSFSINRCSYLLVLDGMPNLVNLANLTISHCDNLEDIKGLHTLTNLNNLTITQCEMFLGLVHPYDQALWSKLNQLTYLNLSGSPIGNIDAVKHLANLKYLSLIGCNSLYESDKLSDSIPKFLAKIECLHLPSFTESSLEVQVDKYR